jgi:CRP/FNR family transcriptional regulator, anaerobic regulatory protein
MLDSIAEFRSSPQIREMLLAHGMVKTFDEGDVLLRENAYIRVLPIVLDGLIKVIKTDEEGHEILVYYIRPGESCIMSFLGGLHHEKSKVKAVVEGHCEALIVPVEQLPALVREYPQWLNYIFRLYQTRFEELLDVVNAITFQKMDERLLHFLQKRADMLQAQTIPITHEQLANELGTARVVISRLLKQLETGGLVKLGRNKITLV